MTTWISRRMLNSTLTLALLGGTAAWVWPFVQASRRMEQFCESLRVGEDWAAVQARARALGYEWQGPPHTVLVDPLSFGRRSCAVQFGPQGLTAAHYGTPP